LVKGYLIFLSLDWRGFLIGQQSHKSLTWKIGRSFSLVTLDLTSLKPDWLFFLIGDWLFFLIGHALPSLSETRLFVLFHYSRLSLP
jgi:hypothetical protein